MMTLLLAFTGPLLFFITKAANGAVRFSDTNVYFYTAKELLAGKMLYRDIFFTNLPLFPYISGLYELLLGKNLELYYLTSAIEVMITSLLLFLITWEKTKKLFICLMVQWVYLLSFIILSTSDYQTGVFLASLFSVLAYVFAEKKQWFMTGLLLGFMTLTKAYYVSIAAAFFLYYFIKHRKYFFSMLLGYSISIAVIISPFLLLSEKKFFADIVSYSLFRSAGVNKIAVLSFFFTHDVVLGFVFLLILIRFRKNTLLALIVLFSSVLLVFYKDVYYLYLNLIVPFLGIGLVDYFGIIKSQKALFVSFCIIGFFLAVGGYMYFSNYAQLGKITDINNLISVINQEKPKHIYGVMEVAPALAYLSNTPLLGGVIDTNENLFYSKVLDADTLTNKAMSDRTLIIGKGTYYSQADIEDPLATVVVNKSQIQSHCSLIYKTPVQTEGIINTITLFRCYK